MAQNVEITIDYETSCGVVNLNDKDIFSHLLFLYSWTIIVLTFPFDSLSRLHYRNLVLLSSRDVTPLELLSAFIVDMLASDRAHAIFSAKQVSLLFFTNVHRFGSPSLKKNGVYDLKDYSRIDSFTVSSFVITGK